MQTKPGLATTPSGISSELDWRKCQADLARWAHDFCQYYHPEWYPPKTRAERLREQHKAARFQMEAQDAGT